MAVDAPHLANKHALAAAVIGCPRCGLLQRIDDCADGDYAVCPRCQTRLVHCTGKSLDAALAASAAALLLLIPASFEPFFTTSAFGATRTSVLPASCSTLWHEGFPLLGAVVMLFVMIFPALRLAALTAVLSMLRSRRRPAWLAQVFRVANALQTWAMLDVFFLGSAVAYARLHVSIHVTVERGALCFVAATFLSLVARATLDKRRVWQLISPDAILCEGQTSITCPRCDLVVARELEGNRCSRCGATVWARRQDGISRSMALIAAAVLLYIPANVYPIAKIPIDFTPTSYTVIGGIIDLSKSHLLGLALLVFLASFAVPCLKIAALSWCALSTLHHSTKKLIAKTRVYGVIEEIGRLSMVDPFTIACFAPVMHFNNLIDGRAEPAATPFAAVVILTTIAVKCFDPRQMWDRCKAAP